MPFFLALFVFFDFTFGKTKITRRHFCLPRLCFSISHLGKLKPHDAIFACPICVCRFHICEITFGFLAFPTRVKVCKITRVWFAWEVALSQFVNINFHTRVIWWFFPVYISFPSILNSLAVYKIFFSCNRASRKYVVLKPLFMLQSWTKGL